jgi:2-polyprenyl-3-methyl-5-hydroxy-6-metoxy-1,4-benzoquinol methylase
MTERSRLETLVRTARGAGTVLRRRGIRYIGYLGLRVLWPRLAYRLLWGDSAPRAGRAIFSASSRLLTTSPSDADLRDAQLLADPRDPSVSGAIEAAEMEALMDRAHAAGITGVRFAFDCAVQTDTACKFTAMPQARAHARRGAAFHAARDEDRRAFNERFGATLLTEAAARERLRALKAGVPSGYRDYAPIDFGGGLTVGQIYSTDSGTGRWDFFNRHIVGPLIDDKRVVDLGANNASMSLMMARAGAREVVAVEASPAIAEFARLNAGIFSWREMRKLNIDVRTGDMRMFVDEDLGTFDVVTAFCSLYYLPEDDMARVIRRAASMGATLILQANEAIHNLPASAMQLARLMGANGYPRVRVTERPGFARPLLVGVPQSSVMGV